MEGIRIEPGDSFDPVACPCCGRLSRTVSGYAYRNEGAAAAYFAGWSEGHAEDGVKIALGLGGWGEGTSERDRLSLFLHGRVLENGPAFRIVGRESTGFADVQSVFGRTLTRDEALTHPWIKDFFAVADQIVEQDPRVKEFLFRTPR